MTVCIRKVCSRTLLSHVRCPTRYVHTSGGWYSQRFPTSVAKGLLTLVPHRDTAARSRVHTDELYGYCRTRSEQRPTIWTKHPRIHNLIRCLPIDHTPTNTTAMPMPPPCQQQPSPADQVPDHAAHVTCARIQPSVAISHAAGWASAGPLTHLVRTASVVISSCHLITNFAP